jgi:BON domain
METSATCEADPWTTGAPCSGTKYYIRDPNHPNEQPSPGAIMAPVSARVSGLPRDQLQAKLASLPASAPPPPAPDMPPRNVRAVQQPTQPVTVFWAPPADQTSLHKTVQWYQCERRPVGGPNWFSASGILAVQNTQCRDPDRPQVKTEYRVCAGNAGGKKCSEPVLPEANMRVTSSTPNVIRAADATLASAVVEKLKHDLPALQPRIQVSATNGIVTLAGSVATLQDKVAVETSVKNVEGMRGLQDNITLVTAAPATRVLNQGLKR